MKKILLGLFIGLGLTIGLTALAVSVFNSNQIGSSPSNGKVLQTNGSTSTWVATSTLGFGSASPLTTKGDLYGFSTTNARLPVGADGLVLEASSTAPLGLAWTTASSTGGSGISSLNGLVNGTQLFATGTATGIGLNINSSGSTHTFTPTVTAGFIIPLFASTTQWSNLVNSPTWLVGNGVIYNATSTNNVGIGTSTPGNKLTVIQTTTGNDATGLLIDGTANAANADISLNRGSISAGESNIDFNTLGSEQWQLGLQNNSSNDFELWDGSDNPAFTINHSTLDAAFGTTTASAELTVQNESGTTPGFNVLSSTGANIFSVTASNNVQVATLTASSLVSTDPNKNLQSVTFTTTGTSGAASFTAGTLNIPQYQAAGTYLTTVSTTSPITGAGTAASPLACPSCTINGVTSVSGTYPITSSGGATPTIAETLGNLTLTSGNLSFGAGDGKLILAGTSTNITLTANPTFTNLITTNSSTTGLTIAGIFYAPGLSNGCLQVTSGVATSTGINCGSGGGLSSYNVISANGLISVSTTTNVATLTASTSPFFTALNVSATSTLATTTVQGTLAVVGIPTFSGVANCNGASQALQIASGLFSCYNIPAGGAGAGGGWSTSSPAYITTNYPNSTGALVGINSSTPTSQLVVQGTAGTSTPVFTVASSTGASEFTVLANGEVGINQPNPAYMLEIDASTTAGSANNLDLNNSATSTIGNGSGFIFAGQTTGLGGSPNQEYSRIASIMTNVSVGGLSGDIYFETSGGGVDSEKMRIKGTGEIGIGTTTPAAMLTIQGKTIGAGGDSVLFNIASTTGASDFNVAANGSTTLSSLGSGCVGASSGQLYIASGSCGGAGTITGSGTNGQIPYFTSSVNLTSGSNLLDNGTVVGINATSSTVSFNIQGSGSLNPFNVASSSGASELIVTSLGNVGVGSSSPTSNLVVQGVLNQTNPIFVVSSSSNASLVTIGTMSSNGQQLSVNSSTTVNSVVYIGGSTNNPTFPLFTVASSSGVTYLQVDQWGHKITGGASPTCGSGCTSVTGDDSTFRAITGTGVTAVTVNFAHTYTTTPVCISADESGGTTVSDASSTPSSVTMNLSASLTTKSLAVICQISANFTN